LDVDGSSKKDVLCDGICGEDDEDDGGPLDNDVEDDDACSDACEPCREWLCGGPDCPRDEPASPIEIELADGVGSPPLRFGDAMPGPLYGVGRCCRFGARGTGMYDATPDTTPPDMSGTSSYEGNFFPISTSLELNEPACLRARARPPFTPNAVVECVRNTGGGDCPSGPRNWLPGAGAELGVL
jgi:hypothetical protein